MGICLVPINKEGPDLTEAFTGVTLDVSLGGLGVVTHNCLNAEKALLCFVRESHLTILQVARRSQRDVGAGWFRIGLEVTDVIPPDSYSEVRKFVEPIVSGPASGGPGGAADRGAPSGPAPGTTAGKNR